MPSTIERGIRQVLLSSEVAAEETIDIQMEQAELHYKSELSSAEIIKFYFSSIMWWALLISAIGLLYSKHWAYYLIYVLTVLNLYTSFCYAPLIPDILLPWIIVPVGLIIIQLINFLMVFPLVIIHRNTKKNPNQNLEPIVTTPGDEVKAQSTQAHV
jgi:hypothetical protein